MKTREINNCFWKKIILFVLILWETLVKNSIYSSSWDLKSKMLVDSPCYRKLILNCLFNFIKL